MMQVQEVMTRPVISVDDSATVQHAAQLMRTHGIGAVPVLRGSRPVGMLTDRDIVVRVVAHGFDPAYVRVSGAMTPSIVECDASSDVAAAARMMERHRVRRLLVTESGALVGLLSIDDVAGRTSDDSLTSHVLRTDMRGGTLARPMEPALRPL